MVSLVLVMPASFVADKLGRKWTIVPSCVGLAAALGLMAGAGENCSLPSFQHWLDAVYSCCKERNCKQLSQCVQGMQPSLWLLLGCMQ